MFELLARLSYSIGRIYFIALTKSSAIRILSACLWTFAIFVGIAVGLAKLYGLLPYVLESTVFGISCALIFLGVMGDAIVAISRSPTALDALSSLTVAMSSAPELEPIRQERMAIEERLSHKAEPDIFDTIQLNLNQLNEYYVINKSQARRSFAARPCGRI